MAKTKNKKAPLRGDNPGIDFTFNPIGMANIRFNSAMVAEIILDAENFEMYVRVTNEITGKAYTGTATLEEEV